MAPIEDYALIGDLQTAALEDETAEEYRSVFDKAARKRFGRLAAFLEDQD